MTPSSPSDDQRFLELLQRWQSGDFTRQDEQTLRSLTESDDFRRTAMEGFQALPEVDHSQRLSALRERLQVPVAPRRVLPIAQILAVAAALLVLVAAIWFFPRTVSESAAPVAQNAPSAPPPAASTPLADLPDSTAVAADAIAQSLPATRQQRTLEKSATDGNRKPKFDQLESGDDKIVSTSATEMDRPAPSATSPAPITAWPQSAAGESAKQFGKAKTTAKPAGIVKDSEERHPPSPEATAGKDSVELAWNDTEKKANMDRLRREVQAERAGPAQSEPDRGWDEFNEYLRQSARLPPAARNNNISGTVRLQFTVNANGDPQNFIVLKSLGYGCDEEAKRLVRDWPWKRGQNPQVQVEVRFVR